MPFKLEEAIEFLKRISNKDMTGDEKDFCSNFRDAICHKDTTV